MKVLFATTNQAKIGRYKEALEEKGIELISINDLDFKLAIDENGKELTDEEMITYYADLVKQYGGKLSAKWVFGMVIYKGEEAKEYSFSKSNFYLVDQPCQKRNPGYPLDSISILPENGKYWLELTEEEKKEHKKKDKKDKAIEFILNNID